jgi:hypothetical protein
MRIDRFKIPALLAAAILTGCITKEKGCTVMGCSDGIVVMLGGSHPDYSVDFAFRPDSSWDTLHVSCAPDHRMRVDSLPAHIWYTCGDSSFVITTGSYGQFRPTDIFLRFVDGHNSILFEGESKLKWGGDFYPNGPECDRLSCQSASLNASALGKK